MRSELKEDNLDASLSRRVLVGGPPCFEDMESCPYGFGNDLLLLIYAFILFIFSMFWYFMISMLNVMIIRLVICMINI